MKLLLMRSTCLLRLHIQKTFYGTYKRTTQPKMGKLITSTVNTPEFYSLFNPNLISLINLFKKYNYELRIAGGAVRDLLTGKKPEDIDFATTATPEQMKDIFTKENIRMINLKGESHGTVTARINDCENYEITTLRIDIKTDGRHAKVEFTQDWHQDAGRRDLTINAMFLDFNGILYDYFNGRKDLEERRVCFVGEPATRIQEDYIRILRYFRFWGRISSQNGLHNPEALKAIEENAVGLSDIAGERIWVEMKKIITGPNFTSVIATMAKLGVLKHIGYAENVNIEEMDQVWKRMKGFSMLPMTLMSTLMYDSQDVMKLNQKMKMSNEEMNLLNFIVEERYKISEENIIKHYKDMVLSGRDSKLKGRILELLKYLGEEDLLTEFNEWIPPKFPVSGYDLMKQNIPKGPIFNQTLNFLKDVWKESDYILTKEELLRLGEKFVSGSESKTKLL
ncbi:CCA tRNA nucleotidyltransferase 1, mitochondrial [Octopus bimaculoides]|nr:CCA tRNA nucleotidyltransferase 1, mitochondrial [Octopus bimaculoides]|eukprot:XP_014789257.1 PREDICTED: CCA tRNA nucleotidyltransferase 1, mitochondrial-like [Octopus bimaculoides]